MIFDESTSDNKEGYSLRIFRDDTEVGLISGKPFSKKHTKVYWVEYFLEKEFRKLGLINKYLTGFLNKLKNKNIKIVMAQVEHTNKISQHILIKHGFATADHLNFKEARAFIKIL